MADENIVIGVSVGADKAKADIAFLEKFLAESTAGVEELTNAEKELVSVQEQLNDVISSVSFRNVKSGFEGVINQLGVFDEKTKDVIDGLKGLATGDIGDVLKSAIKIGTSAWEEHAESIKLATTAYRAYKEEYDKDSKFSKAETSLKELETERAAIGTDSDEIQRDRRIELGKQNQGFARQGTWARWGQNIGQGAMDFVNYGGSGYTNELAEESGKKSQQAQIESNERKKRIADEAKEEEAWAKIADARDKKEVEERARFEESNRKAGEKLAEEAAKREDEAAMAAGRKYLQDKENEEKQASKVERMEKADSRRKTLDDIANQDQRKSATLLSGANSFDTLYDNIAKASSGSGKSPEEIAKERRDQAQKFHDEDIKIQKDLLEELKKKTAGGLK